MAVPVIAPSPLSELSVLTPSWERALRAQNKSPRTIVGYLEGVALLDAYLHAKGMPTNVTHLRRERGFRRRPGRALAPIDRTYPVPKHPAVF